MKYVFLLFFISLSPAYAETVQSLNSSLSGQTVHWYDKSHGNQIEYLAENGRMYLWYPNNRRVVQGAWKVQPGKTCGPDSEGYLRCTSSRKPDLCFKYPSKTRNPVTGQTGGSWECLPWQYHRKALVGMKSGDVFNLALSRKVPFRLKRKRMTLKEIETKWKAK